MLPMHCWYRLRNLKLLNPLVALFQTHLAVGIKYCSIDSIHNDCSEQTRINIRVISGSIFKDILKFPEVWKITDYQTWVKISEMNLQDYLLSSCGPLDKTLMVLLYFYSINPNPTEMIGLSVHSVLAINLPEVVSTSHDSFDRPV